jgi:hypothetical protein
MMNEPLELTQEETLTVLMAEAGNNSLEEAYPLEVSALDEGQGGSFRKQ